jgi:hypothetical protein
MQYFQTQENNSERRRVYIYLVDATDGITPETAEAGGACKVSFNGKAPTTSVNTLVAVDTTNQPGVYYLELSTTEIVYPGIVVVRYKSANTAEFVQTCQIMTFDPYTQYGQFGGGGVDIDYKKIKKLVDEAISKVPTPDKPERVDLYPIQSALHDLYTEIRAIKIPEAKETDLRPVTVKLELLQKAIDRIEMPETDLKPVMSKLDDCMTLIEPHMDDTKTEVAGIVERVKKFVEADLETIKESVSELSTKFDDIPYVVLDKQEKKEAKKSVLDEYLKL